MRHRVQVQRSVESRDAHGGVVRTWNTLSTRWANVEPLRGREFYSARQVNSDLSHKVTMRYFSDVTTSDRLEFDCRHFNIDSIRNLNECDRELEVMCVEVTSNGQS